MKKICIITGSRAEYGLLRPIIKDFMESFDIETQLVVTGSHLEEKFGLTVQEIKDDGFKITEEINIGIDSSSRDGVCLTLSNTIAKFSNYFNDHRPDLIIILGDRYEIYGVASAALIHLIPIAHIHGGEVTYGAIDDSIRHAITKLSSLHFTSTETYRKRVIQLGESPDCVFNVGALGVENARKTSLLNKTQLSNDIKIDLEKPYIVMTYHPETISRDAIKFKLDILEKVICSNSEMVFIITKSNSDFGGLEVNQWLDKLNEDYDHVFVVSSLGTQRYLSLIKYCEFVLGNSSSGIIEVPALNKYSINIGERQGGRILPDCVISCKHDYKAIIHAIELIKSKYSKINKNPYDGGETSKNIVSIIKEKLKSESVDVKKFFYDCKCDIKENL